MISDWRVKWSTMTEGRTNETFPFGFVQLNSIGNGSVYDDPVDPPDNADGLSPQFGYAGLRWSQTASVGYVPNAAMPNVFFAVSYDTPDRPSSEPEPHSSGFVSLACCVCCVRPTLMACWLLVAECSQPIQATHRCAPGASWTERRLRHGC